MLYEAIGAGVAVVGGAALLPAVGFTAGGVAAGSWAASWMSSLAVANGGGVIAGTAFTALQSLGATGLGVAGKAVLASTGAAVGRVIEELVMEQNCTVG